MVAQVHVDGLTQARSALRAVERRAHAEFQQAENDVVRDLLPLMRARASATGRPAARRAAQTLRATGQGTFRFGSESYPGVLGQNFGAHHDRPRLTSRGVVRGWNQFPAIRRPDWFLYSTVGANDERITRSYLDVLQTLTSAAGLRLR